MSRYEQVKKNAYTSFDSSEPVHIVASALLRDNITMNHLAQLKLRNDSEFDVNTVTVVAVPFDSDDNKIGDEIEYTYDDLNISPTNEFGSNEAIEFTDLKGISSFHATVKDAVFSNGLKWTFGEKMEDVVAEKNRTIQQNINAAIEHNSFNKAITMVEDILGDESQKSNIKKDIYRRCLEIANKEISLNHITVAESALGVIPDWFEGKKETVNSLNKAKREAYEKKQGEKKKKRKTAVIIAVIGIVVLAIVGVAISIHQKNVAAKEAEEAALAEEVCNSLAGEIFTCEVDDWGYRYCDFDDDGRVHDYSFDTEGDNWGDSIYYYQVAQLEDGSFALDFASSKDSLFYNGEYEYLITAIEGTQITEFTDTNEYAGYDVYRLGKSDAENAFPEEDIDIAKSLIGNTFSGKSKDGEMETLSFDTDMRSANMLLCGTYTYMTGDDEDVVLSDMYFGVDKINDQEYAIDLITSKVGDEENASNLFGGKKYSFIVTKVDGEQIVEFKGQVFSPGTVYTMDGVTYDNDSEGNDSEEATKSSAEQDSEPVDVESSVVGHNYRLVGNEDYYYDFVNEGTVDEHDPEWPNSYAHLRYEIREIEDDKYALDMERSYDFDLFNNGHYDFEITKIDGNQITEFTSVDGNEKFVLEK